MSDNVKATLFWAGIFTLALVTIPGALEFTVLLIGLVVGALLVITFFGGMNE